MLTFTGIHVTKEFGAPSIRDIAVQGMRLVRFSGAAEVFWPIGMHMLLVADLMPKSLIAPERPMQQVPVDPWLEVHGLLHDAAEVVVADVPRPMKTAEARALEDQVQSRIYAALGVPEPNEAIKVAIKKADSRAALAEGACGCAGRGYEQTQTGFHYDEEANWIIRHYLANYQVADVLNADGRWALFYEARLRRALRAAQHAVSYAPDNEVGRASTGGVIDWNATTNGQAALRHEIEDSKRRKAHLVLSAVDDLYRSQEHRPSCRAVKDTIQRMMGWGQIHG